MADKKISQLDDAAALSANDYWPVNQDHTTGKALKATLQALKEFVLGGTTAGARIFFTVGAPSSGLGVDGDVTFDIQLHRIYQKASGAWVLKDTYGAIGGMDQIRFTSVYGSGGLSADGLTYTNPDLIDTVPQEVRVEADPLIRVEEFGNTPAFDEWDFDVTTGVFVFGSALPANMRITILYSL
ncbi:hypothetical protein [Chitinophaga sp.]|uniref:hypothetical protein n=1 Tax=Chitinophaga sp. TaxID=1869181 RepID=UPI0031DE0515